ncbi:MAG: DHA2 family efflux MFS transporter permease subunit [Mycobacteriaceae bacterium]|nr:DHA2 family efflux MFS transporter permease subunit [Mycobacteriaceae bacterium]
MTDSPAPAVPASAEKLDRTVWLTAAVTVLGAIMSILDVTVVNIAMPTFQEKFDVTQAVAGWTMTAYTLALAAIIPVTGWAADRFGTKRLYLTALVLFVLGSLLCSEAWNISSLIGFRVLQGLGGGMLMPLGMTMMTRAAGPTRVGRVMAIMGIPMLLGPISGPILGGWLIESYSWPWIFRINLPIGLVALTAAALILPRDVTSRHEPFDWLGMVLLSPGLASLLYGVTQVPSHHTVATTAVLVPAAVGLALVAAFVVHALNTEHPLIDLRLFRNRSLATAVATMVLFACAFFGAAMLIPLYYQQVRGYGTLSAGLRIAPQGLGAMLTMPVAGRLVDRIGPGKIVLTGLALILLGVGSVFPWVDADTPYWRIALGLLVMGMGMGCTMMPTMSAAVAMLRDSEIARGTTMMNIINQVGSSIGTAVASVVLTNQLQSRQYTELGIASNMAPDKARQAAQHLPPGAIDTGLQNAAHAFGTTFLVSLALIACTVVPAALLPRRPAAAVSPAEVVPASGV